jgi:hypothetical protein
MRAAAILSGKGTRSGTGNLSDAYSHGVPVAAQCKPSGQDEGSGSWRTARKTVPPKTHFSPV